MGIRIAVGPARNFEGLTTDAIVLEDDTQGVLGADPFPKERYEDTGRLLHKAVANVPEKPGNVLVREGTPVALHAVIHDLESEPTWREEWIVDALCGIFKEAESRALRSLTMPMLGTTHGSLKPGRFVQLLRSALSHASFEELELIRLVVPPGTAPSHVDPLREYDLEVRLTP
jgi:hypothetical protein